MYVFFLGLCHLELADDIPPTSSLEKYKYDRWAPVGARYHPGLASVSRSSYHPQATGPVIALSDRAAFWSGHHIAIVTRRLVVESERG